ncbi:hypothetical protein DSO57_1025412 [Entomophthora muscae]|uniref:Uncharacterized protein n=1 Tax=Entomophthora muscae TaxID=34485 RepID=A0ACC2SF00_9FUNG|nr:hypothetical protein DSO57_1025412 [Entomophthora muscae]
MKYPSFNTAIRLLHNVRYVKGRLVKRPLCIGSKEPATTPKRVKKPAKAKSPTPSPPPHLLPPLPPSPQIKSEADSKPTKERRTKKPKAAKELISSSDKKKEASKKALKNPSPPPPDGSSPLPHLTPKMILRSTPRSSKLLVIWLGIHWPSTTSEMWKESSKSPSASLYCN